MQYTINSLDINYGLVDSYQALPPDFILKLDDEEEMPMTHSDYVKMLADNLVSYLNMMHDDIATFSLLSTHSPQFYNYTTDHAIIEVTSDLDKDSLIEILVDRFNSDETDSYIWHQLEAF